MSLTELKEDLHQMIDKADERVLNMIHAMLHVDMTDSEYELSDANKEILDQRLKKSKKDRSAGADLDTVIDRVKAGL